MAIFAIGNTDVFRALKKFRAGCKQLSGSGSIFNIHLDASEIEKWSTLTHISQMEFPIIINWTSPFLFEGFYIAFFILIKTTILFTRVESFVQFWL